MRQIRCNNTERFSEKENEKATTALYSFGWN